MPAMKSPGRYLVVRDELAVWLSRQQDEVHLAVPDAASESSAGGD
jgi:hypothetical protein